MPNFDFEWLKKWQFKPQNTPEISIEQLRKKIAPNATNEDWKTLAAWFTELGVNSNLTEGNYFYLLRNDALFYVDGHIRNFNKMCDRLGDRIVRRDSKDFNKSGQLKEYVAIVPAMWMIAFNNFYPLETARKYYEILAGLPLQRNNLNNLSGSEFLSIVENVRAANTDFRTDSAAAVKKNLIIVELIIRHYEGDGNESIHVSATPQSYDFQEWVNQLFEYKFKFSAIEKDVKADTLKSDLNISEAFEQSESVVSADDPSFEKETKIESASMENVATSLHSDLYADEDMLGYEVYARAITEFIKHKETKPPISIGVFAPWGLGKTTLLKFIERNFKKESKKSNGAKLAYPTVWFNAWKYETAEQTWAGLVNEIVVQLLNQKRSFCQRELFWIELLFKRIDRNELRRDFYKMFFLCSFLIIPIIFIVSVNVSVIPDFSKNQLLYFLVVLFLLSIPPILSIFRTCAEPFLSKIDKYLNRFDYEKKMGFISKAEKDLHLIFDILIDPKKPLIIFIDDLDRCSPKKTVETVESVNHFLSGDFKNCVFVIGADPQMIAGAIEVVYEKFLGNAVGSQKSLGWSFMDKFIQFPFVLPPANESQIVKFTANLFGQHKNEVGTNAEMVREVKETIDTIIEKGEFKKKENVLKIASELDKLRNLDEVNIKQEILDKLIEETASKSNDESEEIKRIYAIYSGYLGNSPRLIKRFSNLFRFHFYIQYLRGLESLPYAEAEELGFWLMIILRWPDLVRWIQWGGRENLETVNTPFERADYINGISNTKVSFESWREMLKSKNFDLTEHLYDFILSNGFRTQMRRAIETGVW